ncbi:MAG: heparinase, partial [Candidatus Hinthialibacter sp.]
MQQILIPSTEWHPFPTISERDAWERIPAFYKKQVLDRAQEYAQLDVSILPASVYLQFKRNGNRSNYQDIWYERRVRLHTLVIAECLENKGRFLDPIVDMIWAICEETSWTWPAHIGPQKAGADLPDVDDQVVALFSAQTANSMTLTSYLLGAKLDDVSSLVRPRIKREIDRRILTPFLEKRFGWMGYSDRANKRHPNNWNPWICSNVLLASLLMEEDEAQRVQQVHKVLDCLDNFLTYYPSDGSCDEGPSYWGR